MDIITQAHRFFIRHALIQPIQKEIDNHARIDMFDEFGLALRQSLCLLIGQDQFVDGGQHLPVNKLLIIKTVLRIVGM